MAPTYAVPGLFRHYPTFLIFFWLKGHFHKCVGLEKSVLKHLFLLWDFFRSDVFRKIIVFKNSVFLMLRVREKAVFESYGYPFGYF